MLNVIHCEFRGMHIPSHKLKSNVLLNMTYTKGIAFCIHELYRDVMLSTLLYSLWHAIHKLHTDF